MNTIKYLTSEEFRKMQLLQLDMIVELDKVCRRHDIKYTISCGTLLGAVRHKGYIPWDDDADITMLREDYERFKKVANEMNPEICFFQDHTTDPEYLWAYGKLRRVNTVFVRVGQEHIKCKTGVSIDVLPLDDAPLSILGQMLQDFDCYFLRKILWSKVAIKNSQGIELFIYKILNCFSVEFVYKSLKKYTERSSNTSRNRVRILLFPAFGKLYLTHPLQERYSMPKIWFLERAEYEFEGKKFYGIKDYDAFLKYLYGDYMTLPPIEKREPHAPVSEYKF